jgi:putative ABC transport system permease protein
MFIWGWFKAMKKVIDELKTSSVLTKEEIERIKSYVKKKYPDNSAKENAVVLSSTIYEIIDSNLEGITVEEKRNIKKNIIKNTILKDKKEILKWDVFNVLTTELGGKPQHKAHLIRWINKNQNNAVSEEIFEKYVISKGDEGNGEKLASLHIEVPFNSNVVKDIEIEYKEAKYEGDLRSKLNNKSLLIKFKKVVLSKFISFSEKTRSLLEHVSKKISSRKITLSILALMILSLYSLNYIGINTDMVKDKFKNKSTAEKKYMPIIDIPDLYVQDVMSYHPYLPEYFNYKNIDKEKLLAFLNTKNSILAEEPYFSAIIRSSKEFNLNPHILFAITGQEQSFVPKNYEGAQKIANNPFNVFHSWQEYNTDIYDSSRIAARTLINLAKDKPLDIDIFEWINSKYADDKNWGRGVKEIFEKLGE